MEFTKEHLSLQNELRKNEYTVKKRGNGAILSPLPDTVIFCNEIKIPTYNKIYKKNKYNIKCTITSNK